MSFTTFQLFFEDVAVGQTWTSLGRTVTEADIVNFAGLSGDFNPIHMDHQFAQETPFHAPIAHGLLVMSIGSGLAINHPPMRTLAFLGIQEWQFKAPVFIGDTIHVKTALQEKNLGARGRRGVIVWQRQIINQESKVVQEGFTMTMVECRPSDAQTPTPSPAITIPKDQMPKMPDKPAAEADDVPI